MLRHFFVLLLFLKLMNADFKQNLINCERKGFLCIDTRRFYQCVVVQNDTLVLGLPHDCPEGFYCNDTSSLECDEILPLLRTQEDALWDSSTVMTSITASSLSTSTKYNQEKQTISKLASTRTTKPSIEKLVLFTKHNVTEEPKNTATPPVTSSKLTYTNNEEVQPIVNRTKDVTSLELTNYTKSTTIEGFNQSGIDDINVVSIDAVQGTKATTLIPSTTGLPIKNNTSVFPPFTSSTFDTTKSSALTQNVVQAGKTTHKILTPSSTKNWQNQETTTTSVHIEVNTNTDSYILVTDSKDEKVLTTGAIGFENSTKPTMVNEDLITSLNPHWSTTRTTNSPTKAGKGIVSTKDTPKDKYTTRFLPFIILSFVPTESSGSSKNAPLEDKTTVSAVTQISETSTSGHLLDIAKSNLHEKTTKKSLIDAEGTTKIVRVSSSINFEEIKNSPTEARNNIVSTKDTPKEKYTTRSLPFIMSSFAPTESPGSNENASHVNNIVVSEITKFFKPSTTVHSLDGTNSSLTEGTTKTTLTDLENTSKKVPTSINLLEPTGSTAKTSNQADLVQEKTTHVVTNSKSNTLYSDPDLKTVEKSTTKMAPKENKVKTTLAVAKTTTKLSKVTKPVVPTESIRNTGNLDSRPLDWASSSKTTVRITTEDGLRKKNPEEVPYVNKTNQRKPTTRPPVVPLSSNPTSSETQRGEYIKPTPPPAHSQFQCPGIGKYPDPTHCSIFHICIYTILNLVDVRSSCPKDLLFDSTHNECTSNPVQCPGEQPLNCTNPGNFPHPDYCDRYYKCSWNRKRNMLLPTQYKCPTRHRFDARFKRCVLSKTCNVPELEFKCVRAGQFPGPNCGEYYECREINGELRVSFGKCKPWMRFDRELRRCRNECLVKHCSETTV